MHLPTFQIDTTKLSNFQTILLGWHRGIERGLPWRQTNDPYLVLVAEIMLQQTFAKKVVPVYREFVKRYPTIWELAKAKAGEIEELIRPLGLLYRAKVLKEIAEIVVREHNGNVPRTKRELLKLPSVGQYTASAILCFSFGLEVALVDTNTIRVIDRVFDIPIIHKKNNPTKEILQLAQSMVPKGKSKEYNVAILDFASLVCTHYKPGCRTCPASDICAYQQKLA